MPSTSKKQHRFMEAIAHSPSIAKKAGVPVSVGKDFARADDKAGITKTHSGSSPKSRNEHMAQRKAQGVTQKEVGAEFGRHRTTVGRVLRRGFTNGGSAKD
jgi:transposase